MDREGIDYRRRENCFVWVKDVGRAQGLLDRQRQINWAVALKRLLKRSHPDYRDIVGLNRQADYYWSADASEWASDVLFRSPRILSRLYPQLITRKGLP